MFSGSYPADDVLFLLKPIAVSNTPVRVKEALIQSGARHYAELLTHERPPSEEYLRLFHAALALNIDLLARHVLVLAAKIVSSRPGEIVLVSLARAGTPLGVLLKRCIERHWRLTAPHYSISIVRDIGIDENALRFILQRHPPEALVFVDGWTGKGVIAQQLDASLRDFAQRGGPVIAPDLHVLSDLAGVAAVAASAEDYLIPSGILNATVSGLISRSVVDRSQLAPHDFHGCLYYADYARYDLSRHFVDSVMARIDALRHVDSAGACDAPLPDKADLQATSAAFIRWAGAHYGITDRNHIKPGIGEATRVLLRREAYRVLVRDGQEAAVRHLLWLARDKGIPVECVADLPYRAAAFIKQVA
ncbi:MAG: cysteine protease StiP family protein [Gammaproteobacteria bacterium]